MMKRLFLALLLLATSYSVMNAQPRAIGANLGGNIDFSYQQSLGQSNMLDIAVGLFNYRGISGMVCYDWIFPIEGGWNWYVGPGAGISGGNLYNNHDRESYFGLNIGGQIGVEYQFNIPLNLSIDYRPVINVLGFNNGYWGYWSGVTLGIRYRF